MRVLMTADTLGGVWTYAVELTRALAPFGVHVHLATMGAPLNRAQRSIVRPIGNLDVYESRFKLCWMDDPWPDVERAGAWLRELETQLDPDLIHLNDFGSSGLAWRSPTLLVAHSCVYSWFEGVRRAAPGDEWTRYKAEVVRGLKAADLVVAPTAAMLEAVRRQYGFLPPSLVIANGRDPQFFRAAPKQEFVLSGGRLWDEAKNTYTLAKAARLIDWPVQIAGDARHPNGRTVRFEGVEYLGQLPADLMAQKLSRTSIYALPARYEPFGLSVLEAALSGAALVLGDIASLREIWGDDALFVPPDDYRMLAETLNQLIQNRSLRQGYAERARNRASRYSPLRMAQQYDACYRRLLRADTERSPRSSTILSPTSDSQSLNRESSPTSANSISF